MGVETCPAVVARLLVACGSAGPIVTLNRPAFLMVHKRGKCKLY